MKKVGIVGLGKMGLSHFAIVNSLTSVSVSYICDQSKFGMEYLANKNKIPFFEDYRQIDCVRYFVDAVIVSLPNNLHYECCEFFLRSGISVFVEKPFTTSLQLSQRLADLAFSNKLFIQVGFVNRYLPIFQKVRKIVESRRFGRVLHYSTKMLGSVLKSKADAANWRFNKTSGGGCLLDYGSHCIDLANFFFGTIVNVAAPTLRSVYSEDTEDSVSCTLAHANGTVGSIFVNWCDPSQRKAFNEVEIWFEAGYLVANKQELSVFSPEKGWERSWATDFESSCEFYLRGEEYTWELSDLVNKLNLPGHQLLSSSENAINCDWTIEEIRTKGNLNG